MSEDAAQGGGRSPMGEQKQTQKDHDTTRAETKDSGYGTGSEPSKAAPYNKPIEQESRPETAQASKPTVLDIHGYKIGKTLGHGSYATVKEASSTRHKCKVAIKIISKRRAPKDYLEKFLPREIDVVKLLKHPNLIVFLQSIETNNRVYLIMENAVNGDLLETVRAKKFIKEKAAALWFSQLIDGVDYCHLKGVVHRDIKCENLLLDENNNLKITDFGFARAGMKTKPDGSFILSETYCGSYAYAPPEILTGTPYIPQLADIWSCGIVLYVMVFGRLPFDDSNHKKLLKQVQRGPHFPDGRDVSKECRDLITKILTKRETRTKVTDIRQHTWYRTTAIQQDNKNTQDSLKKIAITSK